MPGSLACLKLTPPRSHFWATEPKESEARSSGPGWKMTDHQRAARTPVEHSDEDVDSSVGLRFSLWYVYRANLPWSGSLSLRKNNTQLFGISKNILCNKNLLLLIFLVGFLGSNSSSDFFFFFVNWISLSFLLCKATLSYLCAASMVSADIFGISKLLRAHLKSRLPKWCLNDLKLLLETALEPSRAQPACRHFSRATMTSL